MKSAGGGAASTRRTPVRGCSNASSAACSAWRPSAAASRRELRGRAGGGRRSGRRAAGEPWSAQVDADLVGAAGLEPAADQRGVSVGRALDSPGSGSRRACRARPSTRSACGGPGGGRTASRSVPARRRRAGRATTARYSRSSDLSLNARGQRAWVRVVLGRDHHAGGALVEPVDDAGAQLAADAGEVGAVGQQRVDQRAVGVARRRDARPARPACRPR